MDIKKILKNIPHTPGIYLFRNGKGRIIYIGKASNLSKRVSGYFQKKHPGPRIQLMISSIKSVDYIPTASSAEALIYEASLIKEKKPKYNIALKDDKSYPHLKLTVNEVYPRFLITRRLKRDSSLYYGPYTNVKLLRKAVSMMKRLFPLRTCNKIPKKACLSYHIGQCLGPCINKGIDSSYRDVVGDIKLFLKGRKKKLIKRLSERMKKFSKKLQYEKALKIRNQIEALSVVVDQGRLSPVLVSDLKEL
ncbi:MAG: GIY-YIG nuclease family protein, partial [Candidatus Omnitrophica bacterium]|nr:GIY-YIG nuclease family protein [Candidatus Omnitrophota bacterium]